MMYLDLRRYVNRVLRRIVDNKLTYHIYERYLWQQIKDGPMPRHIAVILDGNRRWAQERYLPAILGHKVGADKINELLNWCKEVGINTITLYVFSTENFLRNPEEIAGLIGLLEQKLREALTDERIRKYGVRIKAIGRVNLLPERVVKLIREVERSTEHHDKLYLNIAVAYGGRAEIVDAVKELANEVKKGHVNPEDIDEELLERYLYTQHLPNPYPDLIVRTSGEERLSNFLLWQGAYSELVFLDVYWPNFRRIDLWRAIRIYQRRERRFGR
jgi:tritrans,polycis-undecaprenyl-diphosphate synthase [geranylgeranyl-diphosphate specific]